MRYYRTYYVYIMANWNNQVVYVGVTNNLLRRAKEHREHFKPGFTDRYNVTKLVYFDSTNDVWEAIMAEKRIKKWRREKKNRLITEMNPTWRDLYPGIQTG